jgi:hypothetical protein
MKIPTTGGVVTVRGNQEEARRCEDNAASTMKMYTPSKLVPVTTKKMKQNHLIPSETKKGSRLQNTPKKFFCAKMYQIAQ